MEIVQIKAALKDQIGADDRGEPADLRLVLEAMLALTERVEELPHSLRAQLRNSKSGMMPA